MKGRIYLISGLGADRRAFRKLVFPEGFEITSLTHIHGNSDYILPSRFYKPDLMIQGGSHFMVYARAKEISAAIQKLISS